MRSRDRVLVDAGAGSGHPAVKEPDRQGTDSAGPRRAAWAVAGFLLLFSPFNVYWALGGKWGLVWVAGCDCIPAAAVWVQQVMMFLGIVIILGRAGIMGNPLPGWIMRTGTWGMAAVFGGIALWNLLGDNTLQARTLFAPLAAALCGLCVVVAREPLAGRRSDRSPSSRSK